MKLMGTAGTMRRREYLASLAAVGLTGGCLGMGPGSTQTPVPDDDPSGSEPTPTATPTPTPTPSLAAIDESTLEGAVLDAVVAARGSSLTHQGSLVKKMDEMASYHSDRMATERTVSHVIDGETVEDRFQEFGIHCRIKSEGGGHLIQIDKQELVGSVSTRGVTVEGAAQTLVQGWLDDPDAKGKLQLKNAEYVGIGATIVTGRAYVTVLYC